MKRPVRKLLVRSDVYREGYAVGAAHHETATIDSNPYSRRKYRWAHDEWVRGWMDGVKQWRKEHPELL